MKRFGKTETLTGKMDIEELIRSIDIVEYISQFVDLEQRGDEWWGLSCFKDEKTPSFSVRQDPPFFYDYSSGESGNVFSFVKKYFRCSGYEAVERLKKYAGIGDEVLLETPDKPPAIAVFKRYKPRYEGSGKQNKTSILPDDFMSRYEKREDKLAVWENEGISRESLDKYQVRYDAFSDRLVYPIKNLEGKIVNVGGRALAKDWKERGERKYTYFYSWGTINTIYGLSDNINYIKSSGEIIIFEGCKSVLLADTWGIHNTGAILTSHLSKNQMKILASLGCRVTFALDKDVDPCNDKNIRKLAHYVSVRSVIDRDNLLGDKDSPVDRGFDVFKRVYDNLYKITG